MRERPEDRPEWRAVYQLTAEERRALQQRKWEAYWRRIAAIGPCASAPRTRGEPA